MPALNRSSKTTTSSQIRTHRARVPAQLLALCLLLFPLACGGTHWTPAENPTSPSPTLDADYTDDGFTLSVYHAVVRSKVLSAFTALNHGNPNEALELMDEDVRYTFAGNHALGGTRRGKPAVRAWFKRLLHLVPSRFEIYEVEVSGSPWNTRVYIAFRDHVTPLKGKSYVNHGTQVSYLSWGSAYQVRTYIDTALLDEALQYMGQNGIAEAVAPPITTASK